MRLRASALQGTLGLLHHLVMVWPAGRPSLYPLWKLFYTAKFFIRPDRFHRPKGYKVVLSPKNQELFLTEAAKDSLKVLWARISLKVPPRRKILK